MGATFVGSAYVTSNRPVAVSSTQFTGNGASQMASDHGAGVTNPVYAPLVQINNSGWKSGLALQNAGGGSAILSATIRRLDGSNPCVSASSVNINPLHHWTVFPPCNPGSTVASGELNNAGGAVAANVNQVKDNSVAATTYSAVATNTSRAVTVPRLWRVSPWGDALVVRNLSGNAQTVTVTSYGEAGNQLGNPQPYYVAGNGAVPITPSNPDTRSVLVTSSNYPIAVAVNNFDTVGQTGDYIGSYTPLHR